MCEERERRELEASTGGTRGSGSNPGAAGASLGCHGGASRSSLDVEELAGEIEELIRESVQGLPEPVLVDDETLERVKLSLRANLRLRGAERAGLDLEREERAFREQLDVARDPADPSRLIVTLPAGAVAGLLDFRDPHDPCRCPVASGGECEPDPMDPDCGECFRP